MNIENESHKKKIKIYSNFKSKESDKRLATNQVRLDDNIKDYNKESLNQDKDNFDKNPSLNLENIKSSNFQKNITNKESINLINKNKNIEEKSEFTSKKESKPKDLKSKKSIKTNFSKNSSVKSTLPDIKNDQNKFSNLKSSSNIPAFYYFKTTNKKNAISLKKDNNFDKINDININTYNNSNKNSNFFSNEKPNNLIYYENLNVPLKYPKRPTTIEYGKSFSNKNSNLKSNNKHKLSIASYSTKNINETNFKNNLDNENNHNENDRDKDKSLLIEADKISENKSSNNKAKINVNLNTYLINKRLNEREFFQDGNGVFKYSEPNTCKSNGSKNIFNKSNMINKNLITKINHFNSIRVISKKKNKSKSESSYYDITNNDRNNHFNFNYDNSFPYSIRNNGSTMNSNFQKNSTIKLNKDRSNDENLNYNEFIINTNHKKINSLSEENFRKIENNNDLYLKDCSSNPIELFNINKHILFSTSSFSPKSLHHNKSFSPTNEEKFSIDNFTNNNIKAYFSKSCNNFNKELNERKNTHNYLTIQSQMPKNCNFVMKLNTDLNKENSMKNCVFPVTRPKTVNAIDLKYNARIKQDVYKSIQDVMIVPTSYLPFSRKRDKVYELEKKSFQFQDIVEKELKEAKKRAAKKIKIKSKNELSNYMIRDYFIGEKGDTVKSSMLEIFYKISN